MLFCSKTEKRMSIINVDIFTESIQNGKNYNFKCTENYDFNFLIFNATNIKNKIKIDCRNLNNTNYQIMFCYCDT